MAVGPQTGRVPTARANWLEPGPSTDGAHVIDIPESHDPHIERLLEPVAPQKGSLRCRVRRIERGKLELYLEKGFVFILAAHKVGRDWLISEQQSEGDSKKQAHIVRLRSHKDGTFTCVRRRYEHASSGAPELLFIRHR